MTYSSGSTAYTFDVATQQAAAWFARLRADDVTGRDRAAFQTWLQQDLEHRAAYEKFEHFWSKTGEYAGKPAVAQAIKNLQRPRRSFAWAVAAAASIAVMAIGAGMGFQWWQNHAVHGTGVGEREAITLSDGSQLTLNTDTRLQVEFSAAHRRIRLDRGQAYFKVTKDLARPFEVVTDRGVVRALGTEFEVYRKNTQLRVTLVEGKVAVSESAAGVEDGEAADAQVMQPGQSLVLQAGSPAVVRPVSLKRSTAWLAGKLVFDDEPLEYAVAEANRYSKRRIFLRDARLKALRISGVYRAGEPDEFVRAISAYFPVRAVREGSGDYVLVGREE